MKPTREKSPIGQMPRFPRENREGGLSYILGQMRVHDHAKCDRMHQRDVPAHYLGKGRFGTIPGVIAEQVAVGSVVHLAIVTRCGEKRTARTPHWQRGVRKVV